MNSADLQLVKAIRQATCGGARVLCTLARIGKSIERDDPQRAQFLLGAVATHPFYKGGRLAFDMLEIEDLILENVTIKSIRPLGVSDLITSSFASAIRVVIELGAQAYDNPPTGEYESPANRLVGSNGSDSVFPRLVFGDTEQQKIADPELKSSDYLYDYVVLGLLHTAEQMAAVP